MNDRFSQATREAEVFLEECGISQLPVDPMALAKSLGIEVWQIPGDEPGVSGMLLKNGDRFGIAYATFVKSEGFQRFSVAHEIGHFRLAGHAEKLLAANGVHTSRANFQSPDPVEREADHFAAGLLMPTKLFERELRKMGDGLDAVVSLAQQCRTSLTATAFRYVEKSPIPVAMVMSIGDAIDFCFMSQAMREIPGLEWPKKGTHLPRKSRTFTFNRNPKNVTVALRDEDDTDLSDWFGLRRSIAATEQIIGLGEYGKTLTILSSETFADEEGEEEELDDAWTPRFHR